MDLKDTQTEKSVIATILGNPDLLDILIEKTDISYFTYKPVRLIYKWFLALFKKNKEPSIIKANRFLNTQIGKEKSKEILNNIADEALMKRAEIDSMIDILHSLKVRRNIADVSTKLLKIAGQEGLDPVEYQHKAQDEVFKATNGNQASEKIYDLYDLINESFEHLIKRQEGEETKGLKSGYISLDGRLGGFQKGHLSIIAGATSMGKTAFAINIVRNILLRENTNIFFVSLEMKGVEISDRLLVLDSHVPASRYNNFIGKIERKNIDAAIDRLHNKPLKVSEKRGLTVADIKAKARRVSREYEDAGGLGLIVIDYLQNIRLPDGRESTTKKVGQVVLEIREMAEELDVPVILLSQLSRAVGNRTKKRPTLSDLRDSGEIEEKADEVIFVYRPKYYSDNENEEKEPEEAEIIVAKGRTSGTGTCNFVWYPEILAWRDGYEEELKGPLKLIRSDE